MGGVLGGLFSWFYPDPSKIIMLGLDAAGKTTLLYWLKEGKVVNTIPTIGWNAENVTLASGVSLLVWDIGANKRKIRPLWKHYFGDARGLVFVVDSVDRERFVEAREELHDVIERFPGLRGLPLLVLANKQDLLGAASTSEVAKELQLQRLQGRKWNILGACAHTGAGLVPAMMEMARMVEEHKHDYG